MTFYVGGNGIIEYKDMPSEAGSGEVLQFSDAQIIVNGTTLDNVIQVAITKELESVLQSFSFTLAGTKNLNLISIGGNCKIEIKQGTGGDIATRFWGFPERRHDPHTPASVNPVITGLSPIGLGAAPWSSRIITDWKTSSSSTTTLNALFELALNKISWGSFSQPEFANLSGWNPIIRDYNIVGKYPIDIITDLLSISGFQVFIANYDHLTNRLNLIPKTITNFATGSFEYFDYNDIYLLDDSIDYSEEFNYVRVIGSRKGDSTTPYKSKNKVVIGYEPEGIDSLINPPEILPFSGGDLEQYGEDWNKYLEENQATMGGDVLKDGVDFSNTITRYDTKRQAAPDSPDNYTNIDPKDMFFGGEDGGLQGQPISIFNRSGMLYYSSTAEAFGGKEEKKVDDVKNPISYSYTGAEFVEGSMKGVGGTAGIDYVKIPWNYKDNPDYSEETKTDGALSTFTIFGVVREKMEGGDVTGSVIENAVVKIEFADTGGQWYWYQRRDNPDLKIQVWAGEIVSPYTQTVLEELNKEWIDITIPWLAIPGHTRPPDPTAPEDLQSNAKGEVAFRGVPYAHYLATPSHPAYVTVLPADRTKWNIILDKATLITEAGGDVISDKKYILLDTDYNWLVTAETTQNPFATEDPSGETEMFNKLLYKPSSVISGKVEALLTFQYINKGDEAYAIWVGQTFLEWTQAKKRRMKLTCPMNPYIKPGDRLHIKSDVIGFDDDVYIMSVYSEINPTEQKDVLDCWRFV